MPVLSLLLLLALATPDPPAGGRVMAFPNLPCREGAPIHEHDVPACADRAADELLIRALADGDGDVSTIDDLIRRHDRQPSLAERFRIDEALLGRAVDDAPFVDELLRFGRHAIRSAAADELEALRIIASERRGRPLAIDALRSTKAEVVFATIRGLAAAHDESALPSIEASLRRLGKRAETPAMALCFYGSAAADEVAMRFLRDSARAAYYELRESSNALQ